MFLELKNFDLHQIAKSGQCFRWIKEQPDTYTIITMDGIITIRQLRPGKFMLNCLEEDYKETWEHYFDNNTDYTQIIESIDQEDKYLVTAAEAGQGIHILNQDPWETTISFIISQRNNIPRIKATIEKICKRYGSPVPYGGKTLYLFPTPGILAHADVKELESLGTYYRAPYIIEAAKRYQELEKIFKAATYEEAYQGLNQFTGIGPKVANCICLFGLHFTNAFPVDTWIKIITEEHYHGFFPIKRYPHTAGIMQQYMFYYERKKQGKL